MIPHRSALITGCSSGIGHATARHLQARGWVVYATARDIGSLDDLAAAGCRTLPLDVTSEEAIATAVRRVEEVHGSVGVLINNAGYSQSGAIETVPMDRVRAQFETNVFGLVRLTQLVLPGMRRAGGGRIVNIGSMGGRLVLPGAGYYHATKYAVEALTDALRFEVEGLGIDVVLVEPGLIRTAFSGTVVELMQQGQMGSGPYAHFEAEVARITRESYLRGAMARFASAPEDVARVIEQALSVETPRTRYVVSPSAHILLTLRKLLPDRTWDRFMAQTYARPRR